MTTVAIHQPEYMPWLGLLDKARRADVFVLLDDVQFNRASLQHRAKLAGPNGMEWLTIPFTHRHPQRIDDVEIADAGWAVAHAQKLDRLYSGAPGYRDARTRLARFFAPDFTHVADVASASTRMLFVVFGIETPFVRSSTLSGIAGQKSERVLSICKALSATRYLAGRTSAESYLDHEAFAAAGVEIEVQEFTPPEYARPWPAPPVSCLSALDAWLCLGAEGAGRLLK